MNEEEQTPSASTVGAGTTPAAPQQEVPTDTQSQAEPQPREGDADTAAPPDGGEGSEQPKGRDLAGLMVELAQKYTDFPYVSACSPLSIPPPKERSRIMHALLFNYACRKAKLGSDEFAKIMVEGSDEFKQMFCQGDMIFIRCHKVLPQLCADGMYQNIPVNENDSGVHECGWYHITTTDFKPFIVVRSDKVEGGFGVIEGNPYHTLTDDEIAAVLQKQKEREAAEKAAKGDAQTGTNENTEGTAAAEPAAQ